MKISPLSIYPSQLSSFKHIATALAEQIAIATKTKPISAFKRNDYLAMALGYKGHSDLIEAAKFRRDGDSNAKLNMLNSPEAVSAIARVYSNKIEGLSEELVKNVCERLVETEGMNVLLSSDPSDLKDVSQPEAEAICQNANVDLFLGGDVALPEVFEARKFINRVEEENAPKNSKPTITIDLTTVPENIKRSLEVHPTYSAFTTWLFSQSRKNGVEFTNFATPASDNYPHWEITARFDGWGCIDIDDEVMKQWTEFKDWLLRFYSTERVHVSERIDTHRWSTIVVQYHSALPQISSYGKLDTNEDKAFFQVLLYSQATEFPKDKEHVEQLKKDILVHAEKEGRLDDLRLLNFANSKAPQRNV